VKKLFVMLVIAASVLLSACTRVGTGEVGLRVDWNKQVQKQELYSGFNQTIIGDVLLFPVKQVGMDLKDLHPQTLDHSTLADLDIMVIYNINPASVGDLYTTEAHSFNAIDSHGETLLMYNYISQLANSAAFKSVNKYNALDVSSKRSEIEADIKSILEAVLKEEKKDVSITIAKVQVKNILPAQSIIDSANAVITAQNAQRTAQVAVGTAKLEAERQEYLSRPSNLDYMRVKSELNISEAVLEGKVNTIIIPHNMTMFGGTK
jgi:regulator of protease activity HflC (stomatin/prohibitin superfamily)